MKFVRYVGANASKSPGYRKLVKGKRNALVDCISNAPNTTVHFRLDGRLMAPHFSGSALDVFDVGSLVYLTDEMVRRSDAADYWSRTLRCLVPVHDNKKWEKNGGALSNALEFLSGDAWLFEWCTLNNPPRQRSHRQALPRGFSKVCLFSGGTDSLLGAVQLLNEGHKVILVGHQAEGQTARAQTELVSQLRALYPKKLCLIQCRVSRSSRHCPQFRLPQKVEDSHRTRSFLFLTVGVAIAAQCGIKDVYMPENGFMALNVPLQMSRIGAMSTRTAHPVFILRFLDFVHRLGVFKGTIRNPLLTQSKTDTLRGLKASLHPLVLRSVSCARPSRYNNLHVRHCGYCVPCIHRRVALMEAGIDQAGDYAFDVFRNLSALDESKQQDFRALTRFAGLVSSASPIRLQSLVLSHGYFPPDVGAHIGTSPTSDYSPWTEMLKRWADDFLSKVKR